MSNCILRKEIKVVGVTANNEDGKNRQDIIEDFYNEHGRDLFFCNAELVEFEYNLEPAYYVEIDGEIVGTLPADISKRIKNLELEQSYTFWIEAGAIVGGYADDEIQDPSDKVNWGLRFVLCLASPEARSAVISDMDKKHRMRPASAEDVTGLNTIYCYKCGAKIDKDAVICLKCGCATKNYDAKKSKGLDPDASPKSRLVALLLCIFLGVLGVHRFYLGKIGTGVVWCLTVGCFYVGWIVDIIMIACGKMTDNEGRVVAYWEA